MEEEKPKFPENVTIPGPQLFPGTKPIWEKGQRLKVTAVAGIAALLGSGGGLSLDSIQTAVMKFLAPLPPHGLVVDKLHAPTLVLKTEDGKTVNVAVPLEDWGRFAVGSYYVARPEDVEPIDADPGLDLEPPPPDAEWNFPPEPENSDG